MADEIKKAIFGYPEWHEKIYNEFKPCFETFPRLTGALTQVIYAAYPNPTQLDHVVLKLGEFSMMSMLELVTLLGNGMGQGAFKILRSMLEYTINAEYLRRNPDDVANFLNWHWIEHYKQYRYMEKSMPTAYATLTQQQIEEAEREYNRVLPDFDKGQGSGKPRGSWSKHHLANRALKAGLQEHYSLVYPLASTLFHGSVSGLVFYYEPGEDPYRLTSPPSFKWTGQSLMSGHSLALEMLKTLCLTLNKQTTPSPVELEEDYRNAWREINLKDKKV